MLHSRLRFILQSFVRRKAKFVSKARFNICSARGIRISWIMASQEMDEYRKRAKLAVCFHVLIFFFIVTVYNVSFVKYLVCHCYITIENMHCC